MIKNEIKNATNTNFEPTNAKELNHNKNFSLKKIISDKKTESFPNYFFYSLKLFLSVMIMLSAIVILCTCISLTTSRGENYQNCVYDHLIWPVVMHDPKPFNEITPPENKLIWDSSVWRSATAKINNPMRDENYNLILDKDEVINSAHILFGSKIDVEQSNPDNSYFYDYDVTNKKFIVKTIDNHENFFPKTVSCVRTYNTVNLKVGYVIPSERFSSINSDKSDKYKIKKIVNYQLKKDPLTHQFYIASVG